MGIRLHTSISKRQIFELPIINSVLLKVERNEENK